MIQHRVPRFARRAAVALVPLALVGLLAPLQAPAAPAPPAVFIDTTPVAPTGGTIAVPAGGDFQAALDSAQPGDVITLAAGATFTGPFTLPKKAGNAWITISSAADADLPAPGTRVTPAHAGAMPKIVARDSGPALTTAPGAHHYRFVGVEFHSAAGVYTYGLIVLGTGDEADVALLPSDLVFDRCYIHGDPGAGGKRGIALNSRSTAVIDSYLSDWKGTDQDTQALMSWNGPGPFKIVNNFLEGAGENVMFGGADPSIAGLVPSDIEFRRNWVRKPPSWNQNDLGAYAGSHWSVKNLFELKNAARVLVDGNVFENTWLDAQVGFAILFTVRNQDGAAPWSVVRDVTFTNNIVRHAAGGVNILGLDNLHPSQPTARVRIANNLFDDLGAAPWGGNVPLFQILSGPADVTVDHNTGLHTGNVISAGGEGATGFVYRNNLTAHNEYGVIGDDAGPGLSTLTRYFPGAVFARNVLAGGPAGAYPPDNFFPPSLAAVGFVDIADGNYRLAAGSQYKNAGTDGKDIGADLDAIDAAINGAAQAPTPIPTPTPPTGTLKVAITQPRSGATVSGTAWAVMWVEGASGSANTFTLTLGGKAVATAVTGGSGPVSVPYDSRAVADGTQTLTAAVKDATGNTGSTSISVQTNNGITAPAPTPAPAPPPAPTPAPPPATGTLKVSVTQPTSGTTVSGTAWVVIWVDGAPGAKTLTLTLGGKTAGTSTTTDIGALSLPYDSRVAGDGTQTLTASVKDAAGNTGATSVSINVNNGAASATPAPAPAPTPSPTGTLKLYITQPTNGATVRGTAWAVLWADGTSGTSNTYSLTVGGRILSTVTTSSTGPVSIPWVSTGTPNGTQTLRATIRDATGNAGAASVSVTVSN